MANITGTIFNDTIIPGFISLGVVGGLPTIGNDIIDGRLGADNMNGGFGNDTYVVDNVADVAAESLFFGGGIDLVQSSVSHTLSVNLENLTLTGAAAINGTGNAKNNSLIGNGANNVLNGGTGADTMNGGFGNDTYVVDNIGDIAAEVAGGIDLVQSSVSHTLSINLENLTLTGAAAINGTGNAKNNSLIGNSANNILSGLNGNDRIIGGLGNDIIVGGLGTDTLTGGTAFVGAGNDTFDFNSVLESQPGALGRDVITDFIGNGILPGDLIDLSTIDANTTPTLLGFGNNTFQFIGANPFTTAGQVRYAGGIIQANTDSNPFTSELEIQLIGAPALVAADFIL